LMLFFNIFVCVTLSKVSIWKHYLSVALLMLWHSNTLLNFQTLWHCFISHFQTLSQ
jgi:hypothetical protein